MKTYIKYILAFAVVMLLGTSCNNDFMDRFPTTEISPEAFFKTVKDLELYTNTYYNEVNPVYCDYVSDNCVSYADVSASNDLIRGSVTPETVGGWNDWGRLRSFNFFLSNVDKVSGDPAIINHHIGLSRLQRAIWYYEMVKKYNDVPWYSKPVKDTDIDLLYKARDPRTLVVDSIMADLDYAAENILPEMGNRTLFNKWYALAIQARICLHEGTFRKYHDELNLQGTADRFLQKAVEASKKIMDSGLFSIDKRGGKDKAYWNLFTSYDLANSPEIILFKDYDIVAQVTHSAGVWTFSMVTNLSRSLMESYEYLTEDGKAIPFTAVPGYEKKDFIEVFKNRDPRLSQTFMYPGFIQGGETSPYRPNLNFGGYPQIKFFANTPDQMKGEYCYTDLPVVRYAEVLLINAEAKAELHQLTQDDFDKTVNEIRSRVEMPRIIISDIMDDKNLTEQYPGISDKALLQIRRERRIELMSEGFRWDDLMRWKAGHLIEQVQQGIYIDKFGVFDVTGDGKPDMGIFKNVNSNTIPDSERGDVIFYYLEDDAGKAGTISLSNGNSGYIVVTNEIGNRHFEQPKYYYLPIPKTQRVINENLEETIFW